MPQTRTTHAQDVLAGPNQIVVTMEPKAPDGTRNMYGKGPYPPEGTDLPPIDQAKLAQVLPWCDGEVRGEIAGLIGAFSGRARAALLALLKGASMRSASSAAGMSTQNMEVWRRDPLYQKAWQLCWELGGNCYETELHTRAMAGTEDRQSMQALLTVVKARNPDYRDKVQQSVEVVHSLNDALRSAVGWQRPAALPTNTIDVTPQPEG